MPLPSVNRLSNAEAAMLVRRSDVHIGAMISIFGHREHPPQVEGVPRVLELQFDDTDSPECADAIEAARIRLRQREAAAMGLTRTPPTPQDARRIIEFAESIRGMDGDLLCTCLGGVSRSAAAALICLATWSGPGR